MRADGGSIVKGRFARPTMNRRYTHAGESYLRTNQRLLVEFVCLSARGARIRRDYPGRGTNLPRANKWPSPMVKSCLKCIFAVLLGTGREDTLYTRRGPLNSEQLEIIIGRYVERIIATVLRNYDREEESRGLDEKNEGGGGNGIARS